MASSKAAACIVGALVFVAAGCSNSSVEKPPAPGSVQQSRATEAQVAAFHDAAGAGDVAKMRELIRPDRSLVNARLKDGGTPLISAAYNGKKDAVECLLAGGADVNARKDDGCTALHFAASKGYTEIGALLLAKGAKVDARKADGGTPLHAACMEGHTAIVKLLLDHGADVNAKKTDADGMTPLRFATWKNHADVAEILRKHGAKD